MKFVRKLETMTKLVIWDRIFLVPKHAGRTIQN